MRFQGVVMDKQTGATLPGASVMIQDINGANTGQGVAANIAGYFTLDANVADGDFLVISNVGYRAIAVPVEYYTTSMVSFPLERSVTTLPPVVITSHGNTGSKTGLMLFGLIAIAIAYKELSKK